MPDDWATKYLATQHEWVYLLDPNSSPPVDIFPFLKWIPAKFATWKRRAQVARRGLFDAYSALVENAHQSRQGDTNGPIFESLVDRLLRENRSPSGMKGPCLSRRDIIFIAGGVLDGAFDTAYHTTLTLLKTLAAYPAIQKRIQDELDETWYMPTFQRKKIFSCRHLSDFERRDRRCANANVLSTGAMTQESQSISMWKSCRI